MSPQLVVKRVFDTPDRYEEVRARLAAEWKAGPAGWSPLGQAVFAELGFAESASAWRPLHESLAFLAALEERLAAAA